MNAYDANLELPSGGRGDLFYIPAHLQALFYLPPAPYKESFATPGGIILIGLGEHEYVYPDGRIVVPAYGTSENMFLVESE